VVGTAASSILDVADQEFVLRVCGSPRHGQIVRLRSPKCTIGSGPRCTLRLRADGVQPVHCLVLRGAAGTVIRRFAADTRLNGRAFRDAQLVPGDRLSVGPIELEVLDADQLPDRRPPALPAMSPVPPIPEPAPTPGPAESREREDLGARLASANRLGRARARRLLRELRSARQRIAELEKQPATDRSREDLERRAESLDRRLQELDALAGRLSHQEHSLDQEQQALQERSEQLERAQADLESQRKAFDEERRRWDTDRAASQVDLGRHADEVKARLAELEAQREALQQDRTRWENEHAKAKQQLAEQAEEIDAGRRTLDARRQDLREARNRWTAKQDEARNKLQAESAELERRRAELDARRAESDERHAELEARQATMDARQAEFDARCAELDDRQGMLDARESEIDAKCRRWEAARAAADAEPEQPSGEADPEEDVQFEEPSEGSPESSEEVLRRLGIAPSFDREEGEDEEEQQGGRSPHAAEIVQLAPETPDAPRPADEEEDESIDDYMARLLDRVRTGTDGSGGPKAYVPSVPAASGSSQSAPAASEATDSPPQAPAAKTGPKGDLSPRAVAPERSVNLSAMRHLANLSARAAIDHHARRRLLGRAADKLVVAVVALATGAILFWIWWAKAHDHVTLYAALAGLVVALVWLGQYLLLGGYVLLKRPAREKADRKDDKEEAGTGR